MFESDLQASSVAEITTDLLKQLKLAHWRTGKFASHEALGGAYDDLQDTLDELVEAQFGKHGRDVEDDSVDAVTQHVSKLEQWMATISENDGEIKNLAEEALGKIQKLKYLLTMDNGKDPELTPGLDK